MAFKYIMRALHGFTYTTSRFKTARVVMFHDTRLAAIYSTLVFFVLVYVVLIQASGHEQQLSKRARNAPSSQLVLNHAHARFEKPSGFANMWSSGIDDAFQASLPVPTHCTGDGSLAWGDDFTPEESLFTGRINVTSEYTCMPFNSQLHISINAGAGGFTVTTWEQILPLNANGSRTGAVLHRFVDHPELATMNLIHIVTASWMDQGLSNVPTRVLDSSGNVFREFADGEALGGISTGEWLALAGIDSLSEPLVMPFFRSGVKEEQPALRLAGAVLLLRFSYSNYRSWEIFSNPRCDVTVEQVPTAWGYEGTDLVYDARLQSAVERTRTGVKFQILQQGQYGQSRWENVVLRLVEALVLFGFARVLTDLVARYALYGQTYLDFVVKPVDLRPGKEIVVPSSLHGGSGRCAGAGGDGGKVTPMPDDQNEEPVPGGLLARGSSVDEVAPRAPRSVVGGGAAEVHQGGQHQEARVTADHHVLHVDDSAGTAHSGETANAVQQPRKAESGGGTAHVQAPGEVNGGGSAQQGKLQG